MARGYLDDFVFHEVRECEDCADPEYELAMTTALKWGASICEKCNPEPNID